MNRGETPQLPDSPASRLAADQANSLLGPTMNSSSRCMSPDPLRRFGTALREPRVPRRSGGGGGVFAGEGSPERSGRTLTDIAPGDPTSRSATSRRSRSKWALIQSAANWDPASTSSPCSPNWIRACPNHMSCRRCPRRSERRSENELEATGGSGVTDRLDDRKFGDRGGRTDESKVCNNRNTESVRIDADDRSRPLEHRTSGLGSTGQTCWAFDGHRRPHLIPPRIHPLLPVTRVRSLETLPWVVASEDIEIWSG